MSDYDPHAVEEKWRERWAEKGTYEADPTDDPDPTFVTVPYPYPSGGMHIGHARTYTVPDVYARYRRLRGDTVLFPIAWHVTGTPIVGAVERLKSGEEKQLSLLRDTYEVPEETLEELETPMGFARYFIENHYKKNMKALGLSIDWRREFTTNDERYSKFITWQYETLRDRGLLEKGLHPVKYCTRENNPVTTHDLLEGEEAEFQDYTLIEFEWEASGDEKSAVVPMATLRPETVYGVTNAFVNPDAEYVRASVDGEPWVVSREAVEKLRLQAREVEVEEAFAGERLVGERVANPVTDEAVPVLPASFVDPDNATGVVMSVPAHSPDDWVALREAKADAEGMAAHGLDPEAVRAIEPRAILTVEGYGEFPARDAVEERGIESSADPRLAEATREVYNREFHAGVLGEQYGEYAGEVVEDVREALKREFVDRGAFTSMYEFTEEVICRCGGEVEVAEQETWFLRYDDPDWKTEAHEAVEGLTAIPENTREQYDHTIDWLNEWPCIRNYGLGTRLPWDPDFVIEPLSDSTIYMAYYAIVHRLRDVPPEDLTREFFDTLFYGREAVENPDDRALALREEWDYWYPVDVRCSANDLIANHLTFYLFHHAELFDRPNWPRGITVMGMGLLEGEKMSSSKGHVVLPAAAIEEYGADTVRFFLLNSAEPWQDYDWRDDAVGDVRDQLTRFYARAEAVIEADAPDERPDLRDVDRWLLSKLAATVADVTRAMDGFETRTASQAAFYNFEEHLRWYRRRAGSGEAGIADLDRAGARWTLREVLRTRLRLLAPFVPFLANELHERLTGEPATEWPAAVEAWRDERSEFREALIARLADDVRDIVEVTGTDPERVRIAVADDWKRDVFDAVVERALADDAERATAPDVGAVMGEVMADPDLRERGEAVNRLVGDLAEAVRGREAATVDAMREVDERAVYADASDFLEREFDAEIEVTVEADADFERAGRATPFRPAIHIE
ncbi:leucine--tRNA ligase [Halomarina pelagica]|uniref:leucine--tRNA ligase n=1 Tax=Halomarina pelagica TaxID=2961599 RepID=UPI0020C4E807|nr:leucine--tRNA ligase [Halomarina sp. BND7]